MTASKFNGSLCLVALLLVCGCEHGESLSSPAPDSGEPGPSTEGDDDVNGDGDDDDVNGDDDDVIGDDAIDDDSMVDDLGDDVSTDDDVSDDDVSDGDDDDVSDDAGAPDDVTENDDDLDDGDASVPLGRDGGAPASPNTEAFRAGSRLRVTVFDDGAGATEFVSFFDTEMGQHCHFQPSADDEGAYYCVRPGFSYPQRFADAACTELVAIPASSCSPFEPGDLVNAPILDVPACAPEGYAYRKVLGAIVPDALFELSDEDGTCRPSTIDPATTYYATEAPTMSDYVRATRRTETVDEETGLGVSYLDGEDGSSVQDGLSRGGTPCYEQTFAGAEDVSVCLPPSYGFLEDNYGSADCTTEPLVEFSASSCDTPGDYVIAAYATDASGCFLPTSVFEMGQPFDGTLYRNHGEGQCDEQQTNESSLLYSFGAPASLAAFPPLLRLESGQGRLTAQNVAAGEQRATLRSTWFDQELGVPCEIMKFSDGTRHCVPRGRSLFAGQYFADEACAETLYVSAGVPCEQDTLDIIVDYASRWDDELDRCTTQVEQVVALEPYGGPVYAMAGTCAVVEPEYAVFAPVGALSPDELAEVSVSTP